MIKNVQFKRILSLFTIFVMVMSYMPVSVLAEVVGEDRITVTEAVYNLKVKVLDQESNAPIVAATVYLADTSLPHVSFTKTTDMNGEAKFNVPESRYSYEVTHDNYWSYNNWVTINSEVIETVTAHLEKKFEPEIDESLKVENLTAIPGDGEVTLTWDELPEAELYEIYVYEGSGIPADLGEFIEIVPTEDTQYIMTGLENGTSYIFKVIAYKENGYVCGPNEFVDATPRVISPGEDNGNEGDTGNTGNSGNSGSSGSSGSGGSSSSSNTSNSSNTSTSISSNVKTEADKALNEAIAKTGEAKLSIKENEEKVGITPSIVKTLSEEAKPLIIENKNIKVEFAPQSLITDEIDSVLTNDNATLELGIYEVTVEEKANILSKASLGENVGLYEVGGKVVNLTAQVVKNNANGSTTVEKINSFKDPVAVTIDLSDMEQSQEEISLLTGVRYVENKDGKVTPIKLGGKYDAETKTFTFYTDQFSYYGILKAKELKQLKLTIDTNATTVNDTIKYTDVAPTIYNNRTLIPLRYIVENLGGDIEWVDKEQKIIIELEDKRLELVIGVTGEGLDVPPMIVNDRTLVPLRYVAEQLGATVMWFGASNTITVVK